MSGRVRREREEAAARESARRRWRPPAYALLLAVLGGVVYRGALDAPFVLDDPFQIAHSPAIRPPFSPAVLLATARPLVTASLALNHALGGLALSGYHRFNVGAHILCALVVFGFTRYTLRLPVVADRYGERADQLALAVAGVFLLHPIQTESVTYVTQRAEIFAAIALLGALWMAAAAAHTRRYGWPLVGLAVVGLLGVLSKPTVIVWPLLFAVYDRCFIARGSWRALASHGPVYALLIALSAATALWGLWHPSPTAGFQLAAIRPGRYLSWQFGVVLHYLRLVAWPDRLCFDCGYLGPWALAQSGLRDRVWLPALLLAAAAAAAWRVRRRYPIATFAVLGTAVVLLPTSSVWPLVDVYVEHRLYLPVALLAMLAVAVAYDASALVVRAGWIGDIAARVGRLAATVAVWTALGMLTVQRNVVYRDELRLWQDSVAKAPGNSRAQNNLAQTYLARGDPAQAVEHARASIRADASPGNYVTYTAYMNLGTAYRRLGRDGEASEAFAAAARRDPGRPSAHRALAETYLALGRTPEALAAAEAAVAAGPDDLASRKMLADLRRRAALADPR